MLFEKDCEARKPVEPLRTEKAEVSAVHDFIYYACSLGLIYYSLDFLLLETRGLDEGAADYLAHTASLGLFDFEASAIASGCLQVLGLQRKAHVQFRVA